jgi:5-methylcytosine-specific restriction endonuclease McrA
MNAGIELSLTQARFEELFGAAIDSLETWQLKDALRLFEERVAKRIDVRTKSEKRTRRKLKHLSRDPQELRLKRAAKRIREKSERRSEPYETYLQSDEWAALRLRIMTRDKFTCVACGNKSSCVHHRSYDRDTMDGKRLHKLVSLCNECHQHVHFIGEERQSMEIADARLLELIVQHDRQLFIPEKMAKECKLEIWHIANGSPMLAAK